MRLFLSSYRFGADPAALLRVTGPPGPIAVIGNAADAWSAHARRSAVVSEFGPLRDLGFDPVEVDLRDHIGAPESLRARISEFRSAWVRGGNTFVLRAQLARSGGDTVLTDLLRSGSLAYAGYSAGACVVTSTLRGIEFSDDPGEVLPTCGIAPQWDGLGLVDFAIVPHAGGSLLDDGGSSRAVDLLTRSHIEFRALTDDEAIVVDTSAGTGTSHC
ncbi:MAG: Type 1 glutamine amidotransferase-like domain-containing protein [Rhodococcus sp. (in: high G+C Gram-positive bacteria)]|uniref:Type 1 glutamine amidotransferase-like domain-containing protein n=1 Tax=Rhodococcus sp. TaxID=1831 RepID=UPI003BB74DDF